MHRKKNFQKGGWFCWGILGGTVRVFSFLIIGILIWTRICQAGPAETCVQVYLPETYETTFFVTLRWWPSSSEQWSHHWVQLLITTAIIIFLCSTMFLTGCFRHRCGHTHWCCLQLSTCIVQTHVFQLLVHCNKVIFLIKYILNCDSVHHICFSLFVRNAARRKWPFKV